eukprot:scaffold12560_cov107-Isochrysis_galbana.AAC.1
MERDGFLSPLVSPPDLMSPFLSSHAARRLAWPGMTHFRFASVPSGDANYTLWDMPSDFTEYYDLHALQETNTGYDGSRVWRFINQETNTGYDGSRVWRFINQV